MEKDILKKIAEHLHIRFPIATFSKDLGFSKGVVSEYYNGKKTISNNFKEHMENFYQIKFEDFQEKNPAEAIPVDFIEMNVMYVPLVNKYAYAGYLNGFGDDEWIEELPKIPFAADREHKGEYLCFEVRGDSMDDGSYESYLEGDILLCRNVRQDFWTSRLHINKWDFVIVHKEEGILVKRIIKHEVEKGILTLHSLNEYYEDFKVHLKDVAKIFNVVDFRRNRSRR